MATYVRERIDPRYLSVNITSSSGKVYRWGWDESDPTNRPSGLTISTQMPGGFATMDCQLQRRADLPYYDLDRFAPVTVYGQGGGLVAFDGYMSSAPLTRGDSYSFSPEAIGWSGALKDNASFSMVYIDRTLSKWQGPSNARQVALLTANFNPQGYSLDVLVDQSGNPGLQLDLTGPIENTTQTQIGEAYYDSGANNVISQIRMSRFGWNGYAPSDPNVVTGVGTCANDTTGGFISSGSAVNGSSYSNFAPTPNRFVLLQHYYNSGGTPGSAGVLYGAVYSNIAVVGNHGLTIHAGASGVTPSYDDGFYGGDIVADIVQRTAPLLTVTRGVGGVVNDINVIPQAAFNSPQDGDTAIQAINQYYLYDYGVYESRRFFWQPPGTGRVWHARLSEGARITNQGPQIETAFNGVVVQYTDPAGNVRFVGPPTGVWDTDPVSSATSSSLLQDLSPTNPVNLYGRNRIAILQMGTTTWQGAVIVGSIFLQTSASRPSSGTASITGFIKDKSGMEWPAWMARSGDTIIFDDTSDQTSRYILNTSYSHDTLTNNLTLDAPPNKLDWLLNRLSLAIAPLG